MKKATLLVFLIILVVLFSSFATAVSLRRPFLEEEVRTSPIEILSSSCTWESDHFNACVYTRWLDSFGNYAQVQISGGEALDNSPRQYFSPFSYCQDVGKEEGKRTISAFLLGYSGTFKSSAEGVIELSYDTVGPSLGAELIKKTMYAIVLSATMILLYVAYRFKNIKFGVCAIIAMLHDSLVLLGVFSLMGHYWGVEIDTLFVTALLTILSFSVHDTIVVYDRIRELKKKHGYLDLEDIVNRAVVETMGRSINNSLTIIFMLLAMYLLGGDTTKWFIGALLIGTVSGTYSSTFTAAPLLIVWEKLRLKRLAKS